ncbi:class I SAM-dependent methyltransferase [Actinophytocola oryzae]|nr:class I SAM-dependent methyltransferase [Actinophytocola oryzae]
MRRGRTTSADLDTGPNVSVVTVDDSVRTLANHYSSAAQEYERIWAGVLHPVSRQLVDRLPLADARRVLDLGTGVGTLLPRLAETAPGATVVGFDRSPGMIARAPAAFPRVVGTAMRLPFATGSFDVAVLAFMLFHLPDPPTGLREARRVLTPGGALGVTTWGEDFPVRATDIWHEELDRYDAPQDAPLVANHDVVNTPDKLTALLGDSGFADVESLPVTWSYQPTMERFVEHHVILGHTARRLAGLSADARADFLDAVRVRLATLEPEDFVDRRRIVAAVAFVR